MKLKLIDKILLSNMQPPREGNIVVFTIWKDFKTKVALTQEEIKKYDIKETEFGGLEWNNEGVAAEFEIEFTELETIEIRLSIKKLDKESKLSIDMMGLVELFGVTAE